MYRVVRLVHLNDRADIEIVNEQLRVAARLVDPHALVAPTLDGSINGGDIMVRLSLDDARQWSTNGPKLVEALTDSRIAHIDGADYLDPGPDSAGRRVDAGATVYRTLLLRVDPGTDPATVARFERETLRMPAHVSTMSSWQLSKPLVTQGNSWTHVWEQTYRTLDGLLGDYMLHPIHWGYIDKWFDPECPERIITDRVCHSLCPIEADGRLD